MMDPEMLRLAQEQMRRMSPDDIARMQQQLMSNPNLMRMASESMKNMRPEDLRRAAEQLNQTRPEDMRDMTEKIANTTPEEFAAMKAQADAQMSYAISGAKMLKKQGNELHNQGQYSDAASKYKLAKDNLKSIPSSTAHTLQLQCTLNLMACYLKTGQFDECISEGSEVLTHDSNNVKAYYRRGQAYKELGKLEAAVADLSKAHEISPEDETIAEVLRDAEEKLAREGGGVSTRKGGVVIEEVVEDDVSQPSSSERSSPGYTVSQPPEGAGNIGLSGSSERSRGDPASIRSSKNYVSKIDPEGLSKFGIERMSPELVKTATEMIGTMKPEELQKMCEVASSMNGISSVGPNLGSNMPEMSPDMLKMASDMIGNLSPDELQKMMSFASRMGGPDCVPRRSENNNFGPSSRATTSNSARGSSSQPILENPDELSNDQRMGESSSSLPPSTADMQETMRNSMKDPAMRQMLTSMMKNMSPEMMANMSEQFGMKMSTEVAAKAQQAVSSLSPENFDRMMRWMERDTDRASAEAIPDGAASDVSSPIRRPYMVREPWDSANICPYLDEDAKYQAKLDRQNEPLSLNHCGPITCLDDESLLPVRESVTQMVFQTAKTVLGLTSYTAGKLLKRCSGFLIDWNKDTKRGTVLTSANLLCTKSPNIDDCSCPREYAPDAEVLIHLLDDTTQKGTLINYHKRYNIALFEVDVNMSTELPPVSTELVDYGQEVFLIGRDEDLNLNASHGRVQCIDPGYYDHYHYMYLKCEFAKFGDGGPAINTEGRIVGMTNPTKGAAFIPHLFTLKCLHMWKDFKCVPQLHLGLKVSSIKFLRSFHREKMSRKFNIDAGLIVREVSEGSAAEKIGIRNGDVIESLNGECIPTVVELEIMLLRTCEHCLDNGGVLGSNVDLIVGLFQMRKQKRCTKTLILNISDDVEVTAKGSSKRDCDWDWPSP